MRNSPFWWILIAFMFVLDLYVFQVVKHLSVNAGQRTRVIIFTIYWVVSASAIVTLVILPYLQMADQSRLLRNTLFACVAGLFFAKLLASVFFLADDLRRGVQYLVTLVYQKAKSGDGGSTELMSRSAFLSWAGVTVGTGLFGSLLYGFNNKYRYQLRRLQLAYENLPASFRGLKIVHISDIHAGSFTDQEAVMKGVEKIMQEKPDLILFTGDLVNDRADEMKDYAAVFSKLSAPLGVYSILGNHDYGEYVRWESPEEKRQNLERLKEVHASMGWRLLLNETVSIEKNGESIGLVGVENWSAKANFSRHGDLAKAMQNAPRNPFHILMSHDPSHWDAEVIPKYSQIDLVLSGHTHGMQFGVEVPGFRWSPVQYVYRQWAGLYEAGRQKLYVNRGFGFIGYPGRVGILPEITVIRLV